MTRLLNYGCRHGVLWTAAVFAIVTLGMCLEAGAVGPNIIVIMSDDVGYNEFGYTAALNQQTTQFETPRIDALAQQSSILAQGYVGGHSVCGPSRAGFFTGQYPARFGFEDNISRGLNGEVDGLRAGQTTIANYLKGLGYTTAAMGKWHLGPKDNVNRPQDVGFDDFYGFLGGGRNYYGYPGGSSYDLNMLRGDSSVELTWPTEGNPSLYDPVRGRYLTDALGEEAASYINQRANGQTPFYLQVAFNATHTPFDVKQQDYDRYAHITDPTQRTLVAMSYAMDRAVGMMLDAVEANNIADNTVIVFVNDNGGMYPYHSNAPFTGHKGGMFEGSIRVPFLIHVPGVTPGTYDRPVTTLDLLPTFVELAGGDANQVAADGVDIVPYLQGQATGDPHEALFWRSHDGRFAVRKGDWKLVSPGSSNPFARLHNLATHPNELTYFNSQQPAVVADLVRELTFWEAGLAKAEWGALGARTKNNFDHFVYRHEQGATGVWSTADWWYQSGTNTPEQLTPEDAYANAILEFRTSDNGDYTATNDMLRVTRYTFMLNELRFTGQFAGATSHQATINGNDLLMVENLSGQLPRLRVDATAQVGPSNFAFQLNNKLQLMHDLEITGDGTQELVVVGIVADYDQPRNVIKSGTSTVTLAGNNTFGGDLIVNNGRVKSANLSGGLQINGGAFAPGVSSHLTMVQDDFVQNGGVLEMELGGPVTGTNSDKLAMGGAATLGGTLSLDLINGFEPSVGQMFELITATDGVSGRFDQLTLPPLVDGMWSAVYGLNSFSLVVTLQGDFNTDFVVDAADYVAWRKYFGTSQQYQAWRERFGESVIFPGQSVPEPAGLSLIVLTLFALWTIGRGRRSAL